MSKCIDDLAKEISEIVSPEEKKQQEAWFKNVKEIFTEAEESFKDLNPKDKVKAFREFYEDYRFLEAKENLFFAHNVRTEIAMDAYLKGPGVMGAVHALDTYMTRLDTTYKSKRRDYMNNLFSTLNSKDMINQIKKADPKLRRDISIEAYEIQRGNPKGKTGNAQAVEIAEALKKINDVILNDKRTAGIPVRYNDTFFGGSMWHDPTKVMSVKQADWRAFIEPLVDLEKTVGTGFDNPVFLDKWFQHQYDNIIGLDDLDLNNQKSTKLGTDSMAQKMLKKKTFIFKDGESVYKYQEKFGESNLFASQNKYINKSARELSAYELFGANPENGLEKFKKKALRQFPTDATVLKDADKSINNQFNTIMKPEPIWGTSGSARLAKALSSITNVMFLGATAVRGWSSDPVYAATKMTSQFGGNIMGRYGAMLKQQYTWLPKEKADRVMAGIGQINEIIIGDALDTILARSNKPGGMSRAAGMAMKFTLADRQFGHSHTVSASLHQMEMGYLSEHKFKDISLETQGVLGLAGIDEELWDNIISKAVENVDGVKWLNLHGLDALDITPGKKIRAKNAIIQMYGITVNEGIPGGKIKQRAELRVNDPNSVLGSFQLLMNQYKNFGMSHYSVLGGIKNYDPSKTAKHIGNFKLGNNSTIKNLGIMGLGLAAASYMGQTAIDLMQLKEPEDPTQPDVFLRHAIRSWAPIIGDLALETYYLKPHDKSAMSSLTPPVVSMLLDSTKLMKGLYSGQKEAIDAFNFIWTKSPVVNTFWAKRGADFLLGDPIRETLDPDYFDREAEKLARQKGLNSDERHFYLDHSTNSLDFVQ